MHCFTLYMLLNGDFSECKLFYSVPQFHIMSFITHVHSISQPVSYTVVPLFHINKLSYFVMDINFCSLNDNYSACKLFYKTDIVKLTCHAFMDIHCMMIRACPIMPKVSPLTSCYGTSNSATLIPETPKRREKVWSLQGPRSPAGYTAVVTSHMCIPGPDAKSPWWPGVPLTVSLTAWACTDTSKVSTPSMGVNDGNQQGVPAQLGHPLFWMGCEVTSCRAMHQIGLGECVSESHLPRARSATLPNPMWQSHAENEHYSVLITLIRLVI